MSEPDQLLVLAASYDSLTDAVSDYESVKVLYHDVKTSDDFDAAVISRDSEGKVKVELKHEQPTRHGAAVGLGWGLAIGAVCAIFPPISILGGLAVGGAAGAAIGAVTGHVKGGLDNDDLKELGTVLNRGQAGLLVVYASNMEEQVEANIRAVNKYVSKGLTADANALAKQLEGIAKDSDS